MNMFCQKTELRSTRFGGNFDKFLAKSNDHSSSKESQFPRAFRLFCKLCQKCWLLSKSLLYKLLNGMGQLK